RGGHAGGRCVRQPARAAPPAPVPAAVRRDLAGDAAALAAQPLAPAAPGAGGLQRRHAAGGRGMSAPMPVPAPAAPRLRVDYVEADALPGLLADDTLLAAFGFGASAPATLHDPRYLRVPLEPHGQALAEAWHAGGPVMRGVDDGVRW